MFVGHWRLTSSSATNIPGILHVCTCNILEMSRQRGLCHFTFHLPLGGPQLSHELPVVFLYVNLDPDQTLALKALFRLSSLHFTCHATIANHMSWCRLVENNKGREWASLLRQTSKESHHIEVSHHFARSMIACPSPHFPENSIKGQDIHCLGIQFFISRVISPFIHKWRQINHSSDPSCRLTSSTT